MLELKIICLLFGGVLSATLNLDPTAPQTTTFQDCTRNGIRGKCVHESYCNDDHVIQHGGDIDDSELRSRGCPSETDWCCYDSDIIKNTTTVTPLPSVPTPTSKPKPNPTGQECLAVLGDECPWCVSLYKTPGRRTRPSGLFCGGFLLGPKTVLTTATCLKASNKLKMWIKVPNSLQPGVNYTVVSSTAHEHYNTGSHEYDFALLQLDKAVKSNGACLARNTPLQGDCYAFGHDGDDQITSTILSTKQGSCSTGGKGADAFCGSPILDQQCLVSPGTPILCPSDTSDFLVTGIIRGPCMNNFATLGSINFSSDWIQREMKTLNKS